MKYRALIAAFVGLLGIAPTWNAMAGNNQQGGTCAALDIYINTTGVTDDLGNTHPTKEGWTSPHFAHQTPVVIQGPTTTHGRGGQTCALEHVKVVFTASPVTSTISWNPNPPACNGCSCGFEVQTWQQQLQNHEAKHFQDDINIAQNARWSNRTVEVCGFATKNAQLLLLPQALETQIAQNILSLEAQAIREGRAFDDLGSSQTAPPDCSECATCPTGQTANICQMGYQCTVGNCMPLECSTMPLKICGYNVNQQPVTCCPTGNGHSACGLLPTGACSN